MHLNVRNSNKLISHNLNNHKAIYYDLNIDSANMESALQMVEKSTLKSVRYNPSSVKS